MTKIVSTNPSKHFETIWEVEATPFEAVTQKVDSAHKAQPAWAKMGIKERVKILRHIVSQLQQKEDDLALLIAKEMGMPISQAHDEIKMGLFYFEWYLENGEKYLQPEVTYEDEFSIHKVFYEPRGVVVVIMPWNFPFTNLVWWIGQNLIAGNVVVFKHSEEIPLFNKAIEKIFDDSELPKWVFHMVHGDGSVGDYLVHQDIDMICFTGSTNVGKQLYKVGAEKLIPVLIELGGSAPGIVFRDADVDAVIDSIYINKFLNCGQVCDGLKRLIVQEEIFDEVVEKLKNIVVSKKVGIAEDTETEIWPLVSEKQLITLQRQVQDAISKWGNVIVGGKAPDGLFGAFYEPTLLTHITRDMQVWQEEVFGPVLPIVSFKTYEEALQLANDTKYGLWGYVFTRDCELYEKTVLDLNTGMVTQNNLSYVVPWNPFGGNKQSGLRREHGKYGFFEVCQVKVVAMEKRAK